MAGASGRGTGRDGPGKRVFFGLELPVPVRDQLLTLPVPVEGARWQRSDQLHLTLAFVGAVSPAQLSSLIGSAMQLRAPRFDLEVTGLGVFGHPDTPRNLWAGVQPTAPVTRLHEQLVTCLGDHGPGSVAGTFTPHITLARFRKGAGSVRELLAEQQETRFGLLPVRHFALFESTPGQDGSVYTVIRRFSLD